MRIDISDAKLGSGRESLYKSIRFFVAQWSHCEQSLELLTNTNFPENKFIKWRIGIPADGRTSAPELVASEYERKAPRASRFMSSWLCTKRLLT